MAGGGFDYAPFKRLERQFEEAAKAMEPFLEQFLLTEGL
jgi:hypothetical protein